MTLVLQCYQVWLFVVQKLGQCWRFTNIFDDFWNKKIDKGYRIYIHILFFTVIVIGYNILFGGLDMDRI
jgi:hypothetical protein